MAYGLTIILLEKNIVVVNEFTLILLHQSP